MYTTFNRQRVFASYMNSLLSSHNDSRCNSREDLTTLELRVRYIKRESIEGGEAVCDVN